MDENQELQLRLPPDVQIEQNACPEKQAKLDCEKCAQRFSSVAKLDSHQEQECPYIPCTEPHSHEDNIINKIFKNYSDALKYANSKLGEHLVPLKKPEHSVPLNRPGAFFQCKHAAHGCTSKIEILPVEDGKFRVLGCLYHRKHDAKRKGSSLASRAKKLLSSPKKNPPAPPPPPTTTEFEAEIRGDMMNMVSMFDAQMDKLRTFGAVMKKQYQNIEAKLSRRDPSKHKTEEIDLTNDDTAKSITETSPKEVIDLSSDDNQTSTILDPVEINRACESNNEEIAAITSTSLENLSTESPKAKQIQEKTPQLSKPSLESQLEPIRLDQEEAGPSISNENSSKEDYLEATTAQVHVSPSPPPLDSSQGVINEEENDPVGPYERVFSEEEVKRNFRDLKSLLAENQKDELRKRCSTLSEVFLPLNIPALADFNIDLRTYPQDKNANELLRAKMPDLAEEYIALRTTANGDCLINAVALQV